MKYYCDGFMIGENPSNTGGGYTIVDENKNLVKREEILKVGFTNNEAETFAIYETLLIAKDGDTISSDSQCCIGWVRKGRTSKRPDLNSVLAECRAILDRYNIFLMWERRDLNLAGIYNEKHKKREKKKLGHALRKERALKKEKVKAISQLDLFSEHEKQLIALGVY